jgi:hypothetical protein
MSNIIPKPAKPMMLYNCQSGQFNKQNIQPIIIILNKRPVSILYNSDIINSAYSQKVP